MKIKYNSIALLTSLCLMNIPLYSATNFLVNANNKDITLSVSIVEITTSNYATEIEQSTLPVVLNVYSAGGCSCSRINPIVGQVIEELGTQYKFGQINIKKQKDLVDSLGATLAPAFIFFKNGKIIGKYEGALTKEALKTKISEIFE